MEASGIVVGSAMESLPANDSLAALKAREAELRRLNDQLERRKAVVVRRAEEAVVRELCFVGLQLVSPPPLQYRDNSTAPSRRARGCRQKAAACGRRMTICTRCMRLRII